MTSHKANGHPTPRDDWRHRARWATALGWTASLLSHGALVALLWVLAKPLDLGLDFVLPVEVEFGVTKAVAATASPVKPRTSAPEQNTVPAQAPTTPPPEPTPDPPVPKPPVAADAGDPTQEVIPEGASVAMTIDSAHFRQSPVTIAVRRFVNRNPQVKDLLEGADLDPLDDLDRVWLASPNLMPDRLLLAGRHRGGAGSVRQLADRRATHLGAAARWDLDETPPTTRWPTGPKETPRQLTDLGEGVFAITRPGADQASVVALARMDRDGEQPWLDLPDGTVMRLRWEGVQRFFRGRGTAKRLWATLRVVKPNLYELTAHGDYEQLADLNRAEEYWKRTKNRIATDIAMQLIGVSQLASGLKMSRRGTVLSARLELRPAHIRMAIGFLERFLATLTDDRVGDTAPL